VPARHEFDGQFRFPSTYCQRAKAGMAMVRRGIPKKTNKDCEKQANKVKSPQQNPSQNRKENTFSERYRGL
jgi:hypothetical protein